MCGFKMGCVLREALASGGLVIVRILQRAVVQLAKMLEDHINLWDHCPICDPTQPHHEVLRDCEWFIHTTEFTKQLKSELDLQMSTWVNRKSTIILGEYN